MKRAGGFALWAEARGPLLSQEDADSLDRTFPRSQGIRRVPGAKLFFPEEFPDPIAEEAQRLWR